MADRARYKRLYKICAYCHKYQGSVKGHGITGITSGICRQCWRLIAPDIPYPEDTIKGAKYGRATEVANH